MRVLTWAEQFVQDFRFAARNIAHAPGFTSSTVLSLALGIGATTAIFSVVYGVIIDPFPYSHPETLYSFYAVLPDRHGRFYPYTPDQYLDIAADNHVFEDVIASTISDVFWTGTGEPLRLRGNFVTVNTFQVMGVKPLAGRYITPDDGKPDAAPVAVLGYKFWLRQFGGDPRVIGQTMRLNDKVRTVVGVMPRRFMWRGADVYLPIVFQHGKFVEDVRNVSMMGRLKPGVSLAQAKIGLHPLFEQIVTRDSNEQVTKFRVALDNFYETFPSGIRQSLWILFGAVCLLLVIACANVSSLLLSRAAARSREMAVRASLGAGRLRLVRQLLTESALIGLSAAVCGVLFAYGGLHAILRIIPPDTIPDESEVTLNVSVLLFALGISLTAAFLFGLAPALQTARTDVAAALKSAGRGLSGVFREGRIRSIFVVAEIALAMILLFGASIVIHTLLQIEQVQVGIQPDRVLTMLVPLPERHYPTREARNAFFLEFLERARGIPGLNSVALNTSVHPFLYFGTQFITVPGSAVRAKTPVAVSQISSAYPQIVNARLLQGRFLAPDDVRGVRPLALVNEKFARFYFPSGGVLGQTVELNGLKDSPEHLVNDVFQVVGVVSDLHNVGLRRDVFPEVYIPFTASGYVGLSTMVLAASDGPVNALIKPLEVRLRSIDPDQPVMQVRTMRRLLDEGGYSEPRFSVLLFGIFAGLGVFLAAFGIYAVINYSVLRQTQEIGVRMALGAQRAGILRMILRSGAKLLCIGIAIGCLGSLSATRVLRNMIWGVSPFDPFSFAAGMAVLFVIGVIACVRPALRASRVDPIKALRYE